MSKSKMKKAKVRPLLQSLDFQVPNRKTTYPENDPAILELLDMLSYRRPSGSGSEQEFIARFIEPLGAKMDNNWNHILIVGADPRILWSAHTDTVHRQGGRQKVQVKSGFAYTMDIGSSCLGADNAAGCWMLMQMVRAKIPGIYVWHDAEECGGRGSSALLLDSPSLFEGIEAAIAFDRRGKDSIVTEQAWGMTASDEFARSLSRILKMGHLPDPTGMFTDTANYADVIPECTNVSSGTAHEHCTNETLDLNYLWALKNAVLSADWSQLVIARDPHDHHSRYGLDPLSSPSNDRFYDLSLEQLCAEYPDVAAAMLQAYGVTSEDFEEEIYR